MARKERDRDGLNEPLNNNIKNPERDQLFAEMLRIAKRGFS